tara:strand:+ start:53957 stop:54283 length:327 start_codon:yes stop_codon:yes gene_type:complete
MRKFKYKAVDAKDKVHEGVIEAPNYEGFLAKIYKMRLYPIEVVAAGPTDDKIDRLRKLKGKLEFRDEEPSFVPQPVEPKSARWNIDWGYVTVVLIIATLMISSSKINF